jgi:hypothetical protein
MRPHLTSFANYIKGSSQVKNPKTMQPLNVMVPSCEPKIESPTLNGTRIIFSDL